MYKVIASLDNNAERNRNVIKTVTGLPHANRDIKIILLHVFSDDPSGYINENPPRDNQLPENIISISEDLKDCNFEIEIVTKKSNDVTSTIINTADEVNADCIAVGGRKRSSVGKAVFGSTTQSVILKTKRPVLVAGLS